MNYSDYTLLCAVIGSDTSYNVLLKNIFDSEYVWQCIENKDRLYFEKEFDIVDREGGYIQSCLYEYTNPRYDKYQYIIIAETDEDYYYLGYFSSTDSFDDDIFMEPKKFFKNYIKTYEFPNLIEIDNI